MPPFIQSFGPLDIAMLVLAATLIFSFLASYYDRVKDKRFLESLEDNYEDHSGDKADRRLDQDQDT